MSEKTNVVREIELRMLLITVLTEGFAVVSKAKMLWLLNMQRIRTNQWDRIKSEYGEVGGVPIDLRGMILPNGNYFLTRVTLSQNPFVEE